MANEDWDDRVERFDKRPVRTSIVGLTAGWLVAVVAVVLVGLIGVGLYVFRVSTSDIKGRGDAEIIKNEARNRIRAQEGFETKYASIKAADKNINVTAESLKLDPANTKLQAELNGQKQFCNGLVADYDADARKFTKAEFLAADLPAQIDATDRETDCKENTK